VEGNRLRKVAIADGLPKISSDGPGGDLSGRVFGVPPSRLTFSRPESSYVAFTGEVVDSLFLGDTMQTSLKCSALDRNLLINAHSHGHSPIKPGDTLTTYVECADLVELRS
jgi:hypothetical protein